jgi:hypothetical protein
MVSFSVGFFCDQKHLQAFEAFVNQFKIKKRWNCISTTQAALIANFTCKQ